MTNMGVFAEVIRLEHIRNNMNYSGYLHLHAGHANMVVHVNVQHVLINKKVTM